MLWMLMNNAWCAWLDWQVSADCVGYIYKCSLVGGVDVACDYLQWTRKIFGIDLNVCVPKIPYCKTIGFRYRTSLAWISMSFICLCIKDVCKAIKCIWSKKQVKLIGKAFQNAEEWCFSFLDIFSRSRDIHDFVICKLTNWCITNTVNTRV